MKLPFTKMHGLGNDFVVFDFTEQVVPISKSQAINIADRHFGIGCDQILIVERSSRPDIDFKYRILNADGGEVEQCGNGARCFAHFVRDRGLSDKPKIRVETLGGDLVLEIDDKNGNVLVEMGVPEFSPSKIPLNIGVQQDAYHLQINGESIEFFAVSMGNPHAIILVDNVESARVESIGSTMQKNTFFPQSANIGFMQIVSRNMIRLRVFERGVGETIACGTGACAAVACGISQGILDQSVSVQLSGGSLSVNWKDPQSSLIMSGPAETVFTGELKL